MEVVGGAGMIVVVDDGGEENTEYLQVRQPGLKSGAQVRREPGWKIGLP